MSTTTNIIILVLIWTQNNYNSIKDERLKALYKEGNYTVYTKEQWDEDVRDVFKGTSLLEANLFKNQEK